MARTTLTGRRAAVVGAGAVAAVASAVAFSPGADAATLTLKHTGTITTHLKTLNQDLVFPTTEVTKVDANTFAVSSTITPGTARGSIDLGGVVRLVTMQVAILPDGPATGGVTFNPDGTGTLAVTQKLKIQIQRVEPIGIKEINLVPNTCISSKPASLNLTAPIGLDDEGASDIFGPINLKGTLDIPAFANCGLLLTPLLNAIASGPGNDVSIALGAAA
ncbi:hypothetical protein [Branchiibius sp. NY16-3462-2]|uniref:hypothetical protein n=1 Tax=Branchiibius sp. NY16-3462-2 TaxID=1807500 RepID=UPI000799B118|nr:hypothetical protein [Branchiibius sp. NY16-3462-2]KYH43774.1 hypothetical protein AZH51_02980 [Branchiibius sp. NY16-3462-2]